MHLGKLEGSSRTLGTLRHLRHFTVARHSLETRATEAVRELLLQCRTNGLVDGHLVTPAARAAAPELHPAALAGFGNRDYCAAISHMRTTHRGSEVTEE
jgi:hypothetical protein